MGKWNIDIPDLHEDGGEYSASQPNCFMPREFLAVPRTYFHVAM